MVVIVALVLAFTSMALSDRKRANVENEMKEAILMSIGQGMEVDKADDKTEYINEQYDKYIKDSYAVKTDGSRVESDDKNLAFTILGSLKKEYDKPKEERELPVFVSQCEDGKERYIIPLWGSGLWGPVWGYISIDSDWQTIYGAIFDHSGETPGLGAEISTLPFESQFKGKNIFKDNKLVGISVLKGVGSSQGNDHAVDGISGGTITSRGVENMIKDNLKDYEAYIIKQMSASTDNLTTEYHE